MSFVRVAAKIWQLQLLLILCSCFYFLQKTLTRDVAADIPTDHIHDRHLKTPAVDDADAYQEDQLMKEFAASLPRNIKTTDALYQKAPFQVLPIYQSRPKTVLSEQPAIEEDAVKSAKMQTPAVPVPNKIYDTLNFDLMEQVLYEEQGVHLRFVKKLGIGGFGLVFQAILYYTPDDGKIPPIFISPYKLAADILVNDVLQQDENEIYQRGERQYVAVKFFKKAKDVDFRRELHFDARIESLSHKYDDVWDYFPRLLYSSSRPLPFNPEDLDFDAISSLSEETAEHWSPSVIQEPIYFFSTIIYQFVPYTLREFKPMIKNSRYFRVYEAVIFYKLIRGISFLSSLNIVHKDIKDRNIMIDFRPPLTVSYSFSSEEEAYQMLMEHLHVKIIDFGLSLDRLSEEFGKGGGKTREYEAPENILKLPKTSLCYDMWSVGILLLEWYLDSAFFLRRNTDLNIVFIHYYIEALDLSNKHNNMWMQGLFWTKFKAKLLDRSKLSSKDQAVLEEQSSKLNKARSLMSPWTKHFVRCLLRTNPSERISASQALKHPYFSKIIGREPPLYDDYDVDNLERTFGDFSYSEADSDDEILEGETTDAKAVDDVSTKIRPTALPSSTDQASSVVVKSNFSIFDTMSTLAVVSFAMWASSSSPPGFAKKTAQSSAD